jgi:hypothetical protein
MSRDPTIEPLPPDLQRATDAAHWPEPPPDLEQRLLPTIEAMTSAAALVGASGVAPPAAKLATLAGVRHLFGSLGLWSSAASLAIGVGAGVVLHQHVMLPVEQPKAPPAAEASSPPPPAPHAEPAAEPQATAPIDETPKVRPGVPTPSPRLPAQPPPPPAPVAVNTLPAEQRLLDTARTALLRRRPELAMTALDEYAKAFPEGRLVEEHAALTVQSLCLLGRADEARSAARVFSERYPRSVFAEAVRLSIESLDGGGH